MSTISSKQAKRHGLVDPVYVLVFLVLILALLLLGPLTSNTYSSVSSVLGTLGRAPAAVSASANVSFTADQQYWDANCNHGWSSNSSCDNIVLRSQSCVAEVASAYCSAYADYLQQFHSQ
jgi:hypothetical protein